jgi:hypothetical protein
MIIQNPAGPYGGIPDKTFIWQTYNMNITPVGLHSHATGAGDLTCGNNVRLAGCGISAPHAGLG